MDNTMTPAARNPTITNILQQTLQDISTDEWNPRSLASGINPTLNYSLLTGDASVSNGQGLGLPSSDLTKASRELLMSAATALPSVTTSISPSSVLGVTSGELLFAAAAEKRLLDQATIALARPQASLHGSSQQQIYDNSLLGLFQQGCLMGRNISDLSSLLSMKGSANAEGTMGALDDLIRSKISPDAGASSLSYPFGINSVSQPSLIQIPSSSEKDSKEKALEILGSSIRKKDSPYVDVSAISDEQVEINTKRKTRGGVIEPFPEKLHRLLQEVDEAGNSDIVSFYSHGRAFGIHEPDRFVSEIMPKYFKQSHLSSFQRQLNLYGFTRISSGPDAGGYYHELFLKGRPSLCQHMRRVGVPKGKDRRQLKSLNMRDEPNFYVMASVKEKST